MIRQVQTLSLLSALLLGTTVLGALPRAHAAELAIAAGADPVSLDPRKTWVAQGYSINAHVFEPLVFREEKDGNVLLIPVLATSWKQLDPTRMEFTLREGVKFHNGEPFNAKAAAYTLTSIMDKAFVTNLKTWLSDIESIEATEEYKLVIKTKYQTRGLLNSLAQVPIVAPEAAKSSDFEKKPIGTGPYEIVSYVPSSLVVIEKFDGYWGTPGEAAKITFRVMPENSTRLAALEAGEVQVAENLPPDKLGGLRRNSELSVVFTPTLRVDYLVLNHRNPMMANAKFREAISLGIDREAIVENLLGGTTKVANSISPPGTIGYDASLPNYAYDPKRAKQLLTEAGYKGEPIKMGAPIGRYSMDKQVNEAVAGMLGEIGLNVQLETLAFASYIPKYNEGAYDLSFIGQTDFTVNPHKHWNSLFYTPSAVNKYSNPEMDKIIEAAREELDDAKASEIFKKGQALQQKEFGGALPLYYEPQLIGLRASVKGFSPRLDEYIIVKSVKN